MTQDTPTVIVTGGAGFIGSALVRLLLAETRWTVVNTDKLTYAGNLESLADLAGNPRYHFVQADIADPAAMEALFAAHRPAAVMHLAAESHVDRSIHGPAEFIRTNIVGTGVLLEAARAHWQALDEAARRSFRFLHVSTDEVFGSLGATGKFSETTAYDPRSPYSASKASSDHLARAWQHTYGLPVLISNCSNNYGPRQFPEKLIPLMIVNALAGKALPIYGRGDNIRDWLYVEDHARALLAVLERGQPGGTYCIGGDSERTNLQVVDGLCAILDQLRPRADGQSYQSQKTFVADRPGHDQRYAIDATHIARELGWRPAESFDSGMQRTVQWYLDNPDWISHVKSGEYRRWIDRQYGKENS